MNFRLENFKFAIYVVVPVLTVSIFSMPIVYETIILNRRYIVYPADQPRLTDEEVDVSDMTPENLQEAQVEEDVLKSLDTVLERGQAVRLARIRRLAEAQSEAAGEAAGEAGAVSGR